MSSWFAKSYFYRKNIHPRLAKLPLYDYWMLRKNSYLRRKGWFKSFRTGKSVDASGKPIPWFVYGAIEFLNERLPADAMIFEYGSGHGTLWWAGRVSKIHTVEHNQKWMKKVTPDMPEHVNIIYRELGDGYESAVAESGEKYDVIILDGRNRGKCYHFAQQALSPRGVIIFDDSNWDKYQKTIQHICSDGFRQMPFRGLGPIEFRECETSVFYRDDNVLGL